jgi:hypothetical protein
VLLELPTWLRGNGIHGLVSSNARVTLETEAERSSGFPEHVVRTGIENGCTLRFSSQDFEES